MQRGELFTTGVEYTPNKSWFDLSYENKFSFNLGKLIPSKFIETMPGDYIKSKSDSLLKFAPLLAPVMHKLNQFDYDFYVRLRDIWKPWDNFITNNDPTLSVANQSQFIPPTIPYFNMSFVELFNKGIIHPGFGSEGAYELDSIFGTDVYQYTPLTKEQIITYSNEYLFYLNVFEFVDSEGKVTELGNYYKRESQNDLTQEYIDDVMYHLHDKVATLVQGPYKTMYIGQAQYVDCYQQCYIRIRVVDNLSWLYEHNELRLFDYIGINHPVSNEWCGKGDEYSLEHCRRRLSIKIGLNSPLFSDFAREMLKVDNRNGFVVSYAELMLNTYKTTFRQSVYCTIYVKNPTSNVNRHYTCMPFYNLFNNGFQLYYEFSSITHEEAFSVDYSENPKISLLPLIAYHFVYDEYFKDQTTSQSIFKVQYPLPYDFQGSITGLLDFFRNLGDVIELFSLENKSWEHDVYTSALIDPQRGPDVLIPLGENGLIKNIDILNPQVKGTYFNPTRLFGTGTMVEDNSDVGTPYNYSYALSSYVQTSGDDYIVPDRDMYAISGDLDLTSASAATINSLRYAVKLQEFFEKKARSGGRYYEMMASFFGEFIEEAKIGRPVYLNGSRTPVQISEVVQTSSSNEVTLQPLGDYAGKATAVNTDNYVEFKATDFGYYITITCVIPRTSYQQGIKPMFRRMEYLDFAWPQFGNLGEQELLTEQLMFTADEYSNEKVFGYQSRYHDWKYIPDEVHGDFKKSLAFWHFGRIFENLPKLNKEFIQTSFDYRQFAIVDENEDHLYCDVWNDIQVQRALPEYGIPSL